ncbi:MAG: protein kinase [Myxococcales bacterium]|nr:protein kinase [Myxococcales bacterium]
MPHEETALLASRFVLLRAVGEGAVGDVWQARDERSGALVAVKRLKAPGQAATARFFREVQALSELRHPNVVSYVDHGLTARGEPYLAMEWLEGNDLEVALRAGRIPMDAALTVLEQVLSALAAAHDRGLVHRDLKPANIFLCEGRFDAVKVLDFGVAKRLFEVAEAGPALAVGTPLYMSPEQARGLPDVDGRSDLFSLGAVIYECLSGTSPFWGESPRAVLAKVCVEAPRPLPDLVPGVPEAVAALVMRMLVKEVAARPRGARELSEDLAPWRRGERVRVASSSDALSSDERRLVAVLMARRCDPEAHAQPWAGLESVLAGLEAQTQALVDGTLLVTCDQGHTTLDLADRAAECALSIRRRWPDAAVALSLGKAVVRQQIPLGQLLDETSQRLATVPSGCIGVDENTATMLARRFTLRVDGAAHHLEGREVPAVGVGLPFVGRDAERAQLRRAFALARQGPRAVVVEGPAGLGKTRLISQFLRELEEAGERHRTCTARGDVLKAKMPFGVARQLATDLLAFPHDASPAVRRHAIEASFATPTAHEAGPSYIAFLAEFLGAEAKDADELLLRPARLDPRLMAEQLALAFAGLVTRACTEAPLVICIDDLQWADAASIRLLHRALAEGLTLPCLLVGLTRPGEPGPPLSVLPDEANQRIVLGALSRDEAGALTRSLAQEHSADTTAWIASRAEGNPFFIEELARTLRQRRRTEIPDAIVGTVQARLDALPAPARRLLRASSVFGRRFEPAALVPLVGEDNAPCLAPHLDLLVAEEILQPDEGGAYVFRHELVREAAYQSLTEGDRVLAHRLAGRWLEARGGCEPALLFEHARRTGDGARACGFAAEAATSAYATGDLEGAIALAAQGRTSGADRTQVGTLHLLEAKALRWLGRIDEGWGPAEAAIEHFFPGSRDWFQALEYGALILGESCRLEPLSMLAYECEETLPHDRPAAQARLMALASMAAPLLNSPFAEQGQVLLETVSGAASEDCTPSVRARLLWILARRSQSRGAFGLALTQLQAGLEACAAAGDDLLAAEVMASLASTLLDCGAWDEALLHLRQSLAFAQRVHSKLLEALCWGNIGIVHLRRGEVARAEEDIVRARALLEGLGATFVERGLGLYNAHVWIESGHPESAWSELEPFVADPTFLPTLQPYALALASQAALAKGRQAEALSYAQAGLAFIEDEGVMPEEGEMLLRLALVTCLSAAGREEEAAAQVDKAIRLLQERVANIDTPELASAFMAIPVHAALMTFRNRKCPPQVGRL